MKKLLYLLLLLLICGSSIAYAKNNIHKYNLRVLYVGGASDMEPDFYKGDTLALKADVKARKDAFKAMLSMYFTSVTAIDAKEYNQDLSKNYDVTIMDGTPHPLKPLIIDRKKNFYARPCYLTEDFNLPILTIGRIGESIGRSIGCKNDWYCLCLDADAHHWKAEHPIFHQPFKVKMTIVEKPTPEDALHYAYFINDPIPKTLPMWRVQTRGYKDTEGQAVGMVARPWGYEDSPECESISSGVCAKTLDAVAIGRHGNFFNWGFAASPRFMTEEAKAVFANAVVYISKFKGKGIIARKYNERETTSEYLKEVLYYSTEEAYKESLKSTEEFNKSSLKEQKKVKEKKAAGETLTEMDEILLNFTPEPMPTRESVAKKTMKQWFAKFGTDSKAFANYMNENKPYLYGGEGFYELKIDEDAKSLGINIHDLKLIDCAIKLLEQGKDVDKAHRILLRYTLNNFATPQEWRAWYNKYQDKLFFTESGGWVWLVNTYEPGVNDYKGWQNRMAVKEVPSGTTSDKDPVAITADRQYQLNGDQLLVLKIKIHPGYHIYSYVPKGEAFKVSEIKVNLPQGYEAITKLQQPMGKPFGSSGILIYEDEVVMQQQIKGSSDKPIECALTYQCCDDNICFPPTTKTVSIK